MATDVTILAAFVAGIFSISSPCVLPLVPIFLTHVAGVTASEASPAVRTRVLWNAAAYVLGFSLVFISVGLALGAVGSLASTVEVIPNNRSLLIQIGGVVLIVFGLVQTGLLNIPFLQRDHKMMISAGSPGSVTSSFLIGVSFGAGWSPCLGPILGSILTMAAGQQHIERAGLLLVVYSLGLAIPFMGAAMAFGSSAGIIRRLNGRLHAITTFSGAVMLGVGIIMLLGLYEQLFVEIIRVAPWTPFEPDI
jgi:cytochrome c-type biogenesis protein